MLQSMYDYVRSFDVQHLDLMKVRSPQPYDRTLAYAGPVQKQPRRV